jgi:hypothetical protein
MTYFVRQGNTFRPADEKMLDIHETLPPGNYTIKLDLNENFFFEEVDRFSLNYKVYGDTTRHSTRIMQTFNDRPATTGVMLTGEKGSGKTLLAKALSIACYEQGIPTIIINTDWHGDKFNTLMQSIQQPCMILFDEFEKVYDRETQPAILTLLDGVFPSKKLFVLTCNDKWRVDEHMRNRPGRIFYLLDFKGLDVDFITEYCQENLNDKGQIENVCRVSTMFSEFNFDMLKSLCEEMNRYKETAQEAIKMLNAKPQTDDGGKFKVELKINGIAVAEDNFEPTEWRGNPLSREQFQIEYFGTDDDSAPTPAVNPVRVTSRSDVIETLCGNSALPTESSDFNFTYLHLKKVDPNAGTFLYVNDKGTSVTFTKIKSDFINYVF